MAEFDPKNNPENFDREFSLNSKKKTTGTGKLPSWIMILAGAAMIAAVVIVRKPAVQPISGTKASVSVQAGEPVTGNTYSITGDEKAGPQELEAHFGSVNSGSPAAEAASLLVSGDDRVYSIRLDELPVDDNGQVIPSGQPETDSPVYWVDEKPFSVSLEPVESEDPAAVSEEPESVYRIDDKAYDVRLEPVSSDELKSLSDEEKTKVVQAGDDYYLLELAPVQEEAAASADPENTDGNAEDNAETGTEKSAGIAPDEDPFTQDAPEAAADTVSGQNAAPEPAIVWLNNKPYVVSVQPYEEAEQVSKDGKAVVPVTVVDDKVVGEPKTALIESDGKQYEVSVAEIDPEHALSGANAEPVIWMDETPLRVELQSADADGDGFDVLLEQLPAEETSRYYESRFGKPYEPEVSSAETDPEEKSAGQEETTEAAATEEPQNDGWFVNIFHNIFGGAPTATPVPVVTVIAEATDEPTPAPTATPILVRMAPTAAVQGPVRLDGTGDGSGTQKSAEEKGGNAVDPALVDDGSGSKPDAAPTAVPMITVHPTSTKQSPVSVPVTVVTETPAAAASSGQPTAVPEQQELPQTGLAESWNIPSLLAMLAGLLLVIAGVRKMRSNH